MFSLMSCIYSFPFVNGVFKYTHMCTNLDIYALLSNRYIASLKRKVMIPFDPDSNTIKNWIS